MASQVAPRFRMPRVAIALLSPLLFSIAPAHAQSRQGQLDCVELRQAVLLWVGDRSKEMLFASQEMHRDGWLDGNIARSAFKDVQIAVMHFDYAYERVVRTREACWDLTYRFGMDVGTYTNEIMTTGKRPENGIAGW